MGRAWRARPLEALFPLAAFAVSLAAVMTGCGSEHDVPRALVDGSPASVAPVELEGADEPVLLTEWQLADARAADGLSPAGSCARDGWSERAAGAAVHRIGADGQSVTFMGRSRLALMGCDGAREAGVVPRSWCGHAHGRLERGRLRDPRLDVGGCRTSDHRAIAFVWVEPDRAARYVVVDRPGFSEAYEAVAGLPVRVAVTDRVDTARSSVVIDVSEHSADGRRLRAYELEARVAG